MNREVIIMAVDKNDVNIDLINQMTGDKGLKIQKRGNIKSLDNFISGINCYSDLDNILDGAKRPSDLDCYYERKGNMLNIEMKMCEGAINTGQLITFANASLIGYMTTFICIGKDLLNPKKIIVIYPSKLNREPDIFEDANVELLKRLIENWYNYADNNPMIEGVMWNTNNINLFKHKLNRN